MKKISILIAFVLITTACFGAGELTSFYKQKFLGINPRINPRLLSNDESSDSSNVTLDETGAIRDRDTFGQYNSSSGSLGSNPITGLFKYYTTTAKYFIACAGTKVALGSSGAFTTDISPSTNTVTSGTFWSATTFNNIEYMFNSTIPMMKYDTIHSGLYSPISTPTHNCAYGAVHKARLWATGSTSVPYRLYYSSLNNGDDWTTTGGYIDLPDLTQTITGMVSWGGYLFIFTETNIFTLQGSTANDFSLRKNNSQVGAIAPRTIKISDIGIIFLSRTGVFAFDGSNSNKLSDKVEPIINSISKTNIKNACGIFDGQGKYWLSYTSSTSSSNNKILIYDTILKEWYPYDNLNINYFEKASGGTDKGELYGGSSTTNGIVYSLQSSTGTESVSHSSETDFGNGTTFNSVVTSTPEVKIDTSLYEDPYSSLLVHFNGTDASTTYTTEDYGKRVVTFEGNAQLDTGTYKFGNSNKVGALLLDGTGDYISVPDSSDWDFGTSDFTIDCWIKLSDLTKQHNVIGQCKDSGNQWLVAVESDEKLSFYSQISSSEVANFKTTSDMAIDTNWHHIAVVRNGTTCYMFLDGISQAVTTTTAFGNITGIAYGVTIGINGAIKTSSQYLQGSIDEVRISKGARWVTDFTPPTLEYYGKNYGTLHSQPLEINASGTSALDTIVWTENSPPFTKTAFQTRTGTTNDSVYFNGWSTWSSASTVSLFTVTLGTVQWNDTANFGVSLSPSQQSRNVLFYETEDNASPNLVAFGINGSSSEGKSAFTTIPITNLSSYNWISGWFSSPVTGNSAELWIGEGQAEEGVTLNTVTPNTPEKFYWYIGDISDSKLNTVNYLKMKCVSTNSVTGFMYLGDIHAHNFYDSGDTISSTPNDYIQYRAIFGSNDFTQTPNLYSVTLTYTPKSSVEESSLSSYYYTKYFDFNSPQINKQFLDIAWEGKFNTENTGSFDSYTKLLLHNDGSNNSTNITDEINNTITANGNAKLSTTYKKFGSASLCLDGTNSYLTIPDSDAWYFGTSDFTIDCWVRFTDVTSPTLQKICGNYEDILNLWFVDYAVASNQLRIYFLSGGVVKAFYTCSWTPSNDTWYHLAFERSTTSAKIFINGISQTLTETTAFSTNDVGDVSGSLYIGQLDGSTATYFFNGCIDEMRLSKGIARWSSNFSVATSAYSPNPATITEYVDYNIDDIKTGTMTFASSVTDNTVRILKHFPSNLFGKTMKLKFYNNDKDSKITRRAVEIRYRPEAIND